MSPIIRLAWDVAELLATVTEPEPGAFEPAVAAASAELVLQGVDPAEAERLATRTATDMVRFATAAVAARQAALTLIENKERLSAVLDTALRDALRNERKP